MCDSVSDAQLLTAYLAGEANAFESLVRRHGRMVYGLRYATARGKEEKSLGKAAPVTGLANIACVGLPARP